MRRRLNGEVPGTQKASAMFKLWHQKLPNPENDVNLVFTFPKAVWQAGKAVEVVYHSDKWEADDDFYPYSHTFDSKPDVFSKYGDAAKADTAQLLQVPDINGSWAMPILAYVEYLTVAVAKGTERVNFKSYPVMTCTPDRKTVVILDPAQPVFISGGQMVVTERGIVR